MGWQIDRCSKIGPRLIASRDELSTGVEFLECADRMRDKEVWEEKANNGREAIKTKFDWNRVLAPIRDVLEKY